MSIDEFLEQFREYIWILLLFGISIFSWVAGKLKEWSMRSSGPGQRPSTTPPRPASKDADEEEEEGFDLATMLGLDKPEKPKTARRPQADRRTIVPDATAPPVAGPPPIPEQLAPPPVARRVIPTSPQRRVARPAQRPTPSPPQARPQAPESTISAAPMAAATIEPTESAPPTTHRRRRRSRIGPLDASSMRRGILLAEILGKPIALRDQQD